MKKTPPVSLVRSIALSVSVTASLVLIACGGSSVDPTVFRITIENVSRTPSFTAQNGAGVVTAFSAALAAIHNRQELLYSIGEKDFGVGLENLAENGDPSVLLQSLRFMDGVEVIGIANEPSSGSTGILAPGQKYTLLISSSDREAFLSLAISFLQGNDILVMTPSGGIPLFPNSTPLVGDITSSFDFYKLGTEVSEAPGLGANQVIRQGTAPDGAVSAGPNISIPVSVLNDGFSYPSLTSSIKISLEVVEQGNISSQDK